MLMVMKGGLTMSRERRRLFLEEEQTAEPGRFGCPMLVRAHCGPLRGTTEPVYRCSLAWALHGEDDVMRCRATHIVTDCWKVHPERLLAVAEAVSAFPEVDYVVITAGTFDLLIEVVCENNEALLQFLTEKLRAVDGVRDTETFVYLRMVKQTYQWGTR